MPNDKVRFLNDYKIIKDKIIYIKDKYILGYDSSNSLAFQFRYWKLKDFNISSNIIALDDDCFIGKHLNKSDFFYVQDRKVTPIIVNNQFIELDYIMLKKKINALKTNNIKANDEQTSAIFKYSLYSTYLFILKIFNKTKFIFPTHTHNAIPLNLNDLKEIYDLIYYSEYNYTTLFSLYRHINSLQFQIFALSYPFIKYRRKIKNIPNKLIQIKYSLFQNYNISLFCINTGSINYNVASFMKSKILMEYLFPNPTKFEIKKENNFLNFLTFKTILFIENEYNQYKYKNYIKIKDLKEKIKKKRIVFFLKLFLTITLIFFFLIKGFLFALVKVS